MKKKDKGFVSKLKAEIIDRIDVVDDESAESDYTFAHSKPKRDFSAGRYTARKGAKKKARSYKITQVEYERARQNRPPQNAYRSSDYIKANLGAEVHKKPPKLRAIRAHKTSAIVITSFLIFELRALFHTKKWRDQHYGPVLKKNARRLYATIIQIQGLFIKFGQMVSVMSYAVPEEFREELEALQDRVPQRPIDAIVKRIEEDLGKPLDKIFSNFNTNALAAASLAQVHEATLLNGERVAVKVQHIGIEQEVKSDLRTFRHIVNIFDFFLDVRGLKQSEAQVRNAIVDELSYFKEAEYMSSVGHNFLHDSNVKVPKVYRKYSSDHVLTMAFAEGIKANDYRALDQAGINRKLVAKRIVEAYCQMVFKDGLIHGDPHPGNILVNPDTSITFLDFGSVVELSPQLKQGIIDLMWGGITRNTTRIIRGLRKVKYLTPAADESTVEKIVDYAYEFILEGGVSLDNFTLDEIQIDKDIWFEIAADLQHLDITYEEIKQSFQLPQDVMLMSRMIMMLAGLCHELHPKLKPFDVIRPYLQRFVLSGSGDWQETARNSAINTGLSAFKTFNSARQVIDKASKGDLQINVKDHRKSRYMSYYLFQQFMSTLLAAAGSGFTYYIWLQGEVNIASASAIASLLCGMSASKASRKAKELRR